MFTLIVLIEIVVFGIIGAVIGLVLTLGYYALKALFRALVRLVRFCRTRRLRGAAP